MHQALTSLSAPIEAAAADIGVDPLPTVRGDRRLVETLFANLIAIAIRYVRGKPEVEVSAEDDGEADVLIRVRDNGIGIPPRDLERIFSPLARGVSRNEFEGKGLGLASRRTEGDGLTEAGRRSVAARPR